MVSGSYSPEIAGVIATFPVKFSTTVPCCTNKKVELDPQQHVINEEGTVSSVTAKSICRNGSVFSRIVPDRSSFSVTPITGEAVGANSILEAVSPGAHTFVTDSSCSSK